MLTIIPSDIAMRNHAYKRGAMVYEREVTEALSQQYLLTNQNTMEAKNPYIELSKNGGFTSRRPR